MRELEELQRMVWILARLCGDSEPVIRFTAGDIDGANPGKWFCAVGLKHEGGEGLYCGHSVQGCMKLLQPLAERLLGPGYF